MAANRKTVVTSSDGRGPITRPNRPAITEPSSGRKTIAWYTSALHQIDVVDRDRAAVAVVDDEDGKPDRGLRRRDGEHQHGKHLADYVTDEGGEGNEDDVDAEQDQLDRHQDDDDVLAVEEDAEDAEREQHLGHGEVVSEPDGHGSPCPGRTWRISIAVALVRATWAPMFWRLTPAL